MAVDGRLLAIIIAATIFPASALAQEPGFFAGLDAIGGIADGSSSTKDGGGFGGGGIVKNVKFGTTTGIGAHLGYRFNRQLSTFVSYQHIRGDIDWDAVFPDFGQTSNFSGTATSDTVLVNVAHDWFPSDKVTITATAGAGAAFNTLSDVTETGAGGIFLSNVEDHTEVSPMVRLGAGIQHHFPANVILGLNASIAYTGGFSTGDTRTGNLGKTSINPYEIDDVWRASLGVFLRARF